MVPAMPGFSQKFPQQHPRRPLSSPGAPLVGQTEQLTTPVRPEVGDCASRSARPGVRTLLLLETVQLEFVKVKCRLFNLPQEFTSAIVTAASISPDANATLAGNKLHATIS